MATRMSTTMTMTKTKTKTTTELIERCGELGIPDDAQARRALHATLATLGSRMTDDEANALASTLHGELASIVDQSEYDSDFDAAELYLRVAQLTNTPLGAAHEQTDVVLRVLGESMDEDVRLRLCRALPEPIARVLKGPDLDEQPPPSHPPPRSSVTPRLSTLAAGRPGSQHPVSESGPSPGQTHSVATNREPHADTKLSSTRGLTQERFGETLAEGKGPRPERPVSEATDATTLISDNHDDA